MAIELADRGTPVVLVARDAARLDELATEVRGRHGVEAEVIVADLTDPADRAKVEDRLAVDPAIDLLVNNAGFATFGQFATLDPEAEEREVMLNVVAVVRLTRAVLPSMVERGRGWILNVSSVASLQPAPLIATYGATKAFVSSFSESLHEELRRTGVQVTAVLPGFTRTEFQQRAGLSYTSGVPNFLWQSPEACASAALSGAAAGRPIVVPGALNKVAVATTSPLPRRLKRFLAGRMGARYRR